MNASQIMITGPRRSELVPFEIPDQDLGPSEIIVRTKATLLSSGTEGAGFQGQGLPGRAPRAYPRQTGYANVGEVIAVGGPEAGVTVGDVVYTMSPHASHIRLDTALRPCIKVPEGVAPEEATFVRLATVPFTSIRTSFARAGDRAAAVGLGLIGNLGAQLLREAGMSVTGVDLVASRRELAGRCGIETTIDPREEGAVRPEHRLVLEASGTARGTMTAVAMAQVGGEVSLVGTPWVPDPSVLASPMLEAIHLRFVTIRSGWEWQLPTLEPGTVPDGRVVGPGGPLADSIHVPGSTVHSSHYVFDLLRRGRLNVRELITHRYAPSDCQYAYEGAVDRKDEQLGVIFNWDN